MSDVNRRCFQPLMEPGQLRSHLDAQLCVQIRQRFVKQERFGLANDGPAHGHALTLTTGKLFGFSIQQ